MVAVAAGKGGVGKSTLTAQLALDLTESGHRVGVIDADLYGPSLKRMLPEDRMPKKQGNLIFPALCRGIKIISLAHFNNEASAASIRAPIANRFIEQFLTQVDFGDVDIILVDFPPGTGDIQLTLCQKGRLDAALLITTPQEISLLDVRRAASLFIKLNIPLLGIIENMSYLIDAPHITPFGSGGGERLAQELAIPLIAKVPLDPKISSQADLGFTEAQLSLAAPILAHLQDLKKDEEPHIELKEDAFYFQKRELSFASLQRSCPCAACQTSEKKVDAAVQVSSVQRVGRYGLRFRFSSGCSSGIYPFEQLRSLDA